MIHDTGEHVRNRLHAPMRMFGKAGDVVVGIVRAKVIEKEKRIEVIQTSGGNYTPELNACAVRCWFRLYDALNFS